jgi:hypothetical protein
MVNVFHFWDIHQHFEINLSSFFIRSQNRIQLNILGVIKQYSSVSGQDIIIPKRIPRDPTDILKVKNTSL